MPAISRETQPKQQSSELDTLKAIMGDPTLPVTVRQDILLAMIESLANYAIDQAAATAVMQLTARYLGGRSPVITTASLQVPEFQQAMAVVQAAAPLKRKNLVMDVVESLKGRFFEPEPTYDIYGKIELQSRIFLKKP